MKKGPPVAGRTPWQVSSSTAASPPNHSTDSRQVHHLHCPTDSGQCPDGPSPRPGESDSPAANAGPLDPGPKSGPEVDSPAAGVGHLDPNHQGLDVSNHYDPGPVLAKDSHPHSVPLVIAQCFPILALPALAMDPAPALSWSSCPISVVKEAPEEVR